MALYKSTVGGVEYKGQKSFIEAGLTTQTTPWLPIRNWIMPFDGLFNFTCFSVNANAGALELKVNDVVVQSIQAPAHTSTQVMIHCNALVKRGDAIEISYTGGGSNYCYGNGGHYNNLEEITVC